MGCLLLSFPRLRGVAPPLPRVGWANLVADDDIKPGTAVRWGDVSEGEEGLLWRMIISSQGQRFDGDLGG